MPLYEKKLTDRLSVDALYTAFEQTFSPRFAFPGESHDVWELDFFVSGLGGITSGTELYECRAGELVIHPPRVLHSFWTGEHESATTLTVSFSARVGGALIPTGKFVLTESERRLVSLLRSEIVTVFGGHLPVHCELSDETSQIVKNLLETLLLSLSRRRTDALPAAVGLRKEQFSRIAAYLAEHICEPLDTDRICADCRIGKSALKDLFHRYAGMGVIQYYNLLRVRHAAELLASDRSIAEIARDMNFSSQNYFSSFFKRETGVSPLQYRKRPQKG